MKNKIFIKKTCEAMDGVVNYVTYKIKSGKFQGIEITIAFDRKENFSELFFGDDLDFVKKVDGDVSFNEYKICEIIGMYIAE